MSYRVLWVPRAEQELATIWTTAPDRSEVTRAANAIDERLHSHPEHLGESRANDRRIVIEPPLGVIFRVHPDDQTVLVLTVWRFETR